jgi:hypothetical protein
MTADQRLFEIACSFPALRYKGVEQGHIPGITPTDFYDLDLGIAVKEKSVAPFLF